MSLTSSMWTGISGLLAHGEKMNVLGNNIANVNTLGYKAQRMDFEDFIYQDFNTGAGPAQIGRGVSVAAVMQDFGQGAFETTTEATDLAIGGRGFFKVSVKGEDTNYYTRAGNFRFDKDGFLVDPHGYVLQGWEIENEGPNIASSSQAGTSNSSKIKGAGVPKDIQLDGFTAQPQHTTNITLVSNLDASDGGDNSTDTTDPFFSLFKLWDGTNTDEPIGESAYAYQTSIKIYDEGGTAHTATVYYDQVSVSNAGGQQYWEYMVTIDPSEDNRVLNGVEVGSSAAAGVLMTGTLTFDTSGQLVDQSAFTLSNVAATGPSDFESLSNWTPAQFSTNGYPMVTPNFSGQSNASYVGAANADFPVEINFGLRNSLAPGAWSGTPPTDAAAVGTSASNLASLGAFAERQSQSTTSFTGTSSTLFASQDGYTFGFLQNVSVDRDGILQGRYSNGVTLELYQVTLYDFQGKNALLREGGNLFSETRESGVPTPGPANANGLGSVHSNSLEQSNVDMAREFVQMIATQRGFQANGKVITTTDTMLNEVIMLKR